MIQSLGDGRPRIHADAFIHTQAAVIGDVVIGARSSVWPAAVVRGDMGSIEVGEETSIQDGAVVHLTQGLSDTRIGSRVTVGHRAIIHGAAVEDMCLIGMGAIILDNAVVGAGSLVGAGALLTAGTVIPPGSLVLGSPARVIRAVNENERAMLETGWRAYVNLVERYRTELRTTSKD